MKLYGKAESAAARIIEAFKARTVPAALAPIFIKSKADTPCRSWSVCNQLLTALAGHSDARGFRQWKKGRAECPQGREGVSDPRAVRSQGRDHRRYL